MRIVAALGGNALLRRSDPPDAAVQEDRVAAAVRALAPLADEHELLITHGNGPQVGLLALESSADRALARPYPLDVLGAETQGMIGYWLARELRRARPAREVAAVITQTVVRPDDPAFGRPAKFVGPSYPEAEASRLAAANGWTVRRDGNAWRRVVPSPEPWDVMELPVIARLLDQGCITIAAGGGGVPVTADGLHGVEAVVDKDLTAALLAERLHADALLLLTDVPGIIAGYGGPNPRLIRHATPEDLNGLPDGSMGPKAEAARRFAAHRPGAIAAIGALTDAQAILDGRTGTRVLIPADAMT